MEQTMTNSVTIVMMVLTALMAAITCILAPFAVPIGPVPISLATMIFFLSVYVLKTKYATISCLLYLCLGLIGLPVFSGFEGGVGKLLGPTGGYIIGYLPMVFVAGILIAITENKIKNIIAKRILQGLSCVLAEVILYILGTAWFMYSTGNPLGAALGLCVVPFIPGDIIKIIIAVVVGPLLATLVTKVTGLSVKTEE